MPPTETPRELRPRPSRAEIDPVARAIVRRHREEVMATARRWADTPEDAEDAFQRGLEIMLTKAPSTDPDHLLPWLKTVVKREAWAIRRQRERHTPPAPEGSDLDSPGPTTAHDQAEFFERMQLGAEALRRLKPQEVRAFVLKAKGLSYREICAETGWTYTKVNRALSEGRKAFAARIEGIQAGAECDRLAPQLSALADGEAGAEDMAVLRPHMRTCLVCRTRLRDYRAVPARVAAATPPVTVGFSLLGWISERSASLAIRWHQAAELAAAHKLAAVAASTAVLAGGGAATVATLDTGNRPVAPRTTPGRSTAPSPPPAPSGNERRNTRAARSGGGATRQAPRRREAAPADRDPAPRARPADELSEPGPSAGEFTPGPALTGPAATKPAEAPRSGDWEHEGGGEFAP
ncbi:MAG TPA: sigma-70 family RNA polymerase sigma factor [Thermoleophilaceae bacterium]|jgi:RNA polymerase sigma factor (sigma-70 family)